MTPAQVITNLLFSIARLVIVLGSLASTFFFFAVATALVFTYPIPDTLITIGTTLATCALLNALIMMAKPKHRQHAGPMSIIAPFVPFDKEKPLLVFSARFHSLLYWVWMILFVQGSLTAMPKMGAILFLLTTPFAWNYAIARAKLEKENPS